MAQMSPVRWEMARTCAAPALNLMRRTGRLSKFSPQFLNP
jgi:hypothetical protein